MDDVYCWTTNETIAAFLVIEIPTMISVLVRADYLNGIDFKNTLNSSENWAILLKLIREQ